MTTSRLAHSIVVILDEIRGFVDVGHVRAGQDAAAIVNRLNAEIVKALDRRDVKERFQSAAIEAVGSTPQAFAGILRADMAKWGKVIREAGIQE